MCQHEGGCSKISINLEEKKSREGGQTKETEAATAVESKQQDKRKSMESARATHDKFVQRQKRKAKLDELAQTVEKKRKHWL